MFSFIQCQTHKQWMDLFEWIEIIKFTCVALAAKLIKFNSLSSNTVCHQFNYARWSTFLSRDFTNLCASSPVSEVLRLCISLKCRPMVIRAVNNSNNRMTQYDSGPGWSTHEWLKQSALDTTPHTHTLPTVRTMNVWKPTKKICLSKPLKSTMGLESRRIYYYYRFLQYFLQSTMDFFRCRRTVRNTMVSLRRVNSFTQLIASNLKCNWSGAENPQFNLTAFEILFKRNVHTQTTFVWQPLLCCSATIT